MKKELTPNQAKVLKTIKEFIQERGFSPTFGELKQLLSEKSLPLKSNNSVAQYLNVLQDRGYIQKFNKARGIRVISGGIRNFVSLPLLGRANCGEALSYADDVAEDYIDISNEYIEGNEENYFFLNAVGDSMNKSGIKDGDLVLVKKIEGNPNENQSVVAVINGLGTIKKFRHIDSTPVLLPNSTNPEHKPIILHPDDQVSICGKVVRVFNFSTMENKN